MRMYVLCCILFAAATKLCGAIDNFTISALLCGDPGASCIDQLLIDATLRVGGGSPSDTWAVLSLPSGTLIPGDSSSSGDTAVLLNKVDAVVTSTFSAVSYNLTTPFTLTPSLVMQSTSTFASESECTTANAAEAVCCDSPRGDGVWVAYWLGSNTSDVQTCWSASAGVPLWTVQATIQQLSNRTVGASVNITESYSVASAAFAEDHVNLTAARQTVTLSAAAQVDLQSTYICFGSRSNTLPLAVPKNAFINDAMSPQGLARNSTNFRSYFTCPTNAAAASMITAADSLAPYWGSFVTNLFPAVSGCAIASPSASLSAEIAANGNGRWSQNALLLVQCKDLLTVTAAISLSVDGGSLLDHAQPAPVVTSVQLSPSGTLLLAQLVNQNGVAGAVTIGCPDPSPTPMCMQANSVVRTSPQTRSVLLAAYSTSMTAFSIVLPQPSVRNISCSIVVWRNEIVLSNTVVSFAFASSFPHVDVSSDVVSSSSGSCAPPCSSVQCAELYGTANPPRTFYDTSTHECVAVASCSASQFLDTATNTCIDLNGGSIVPLPPPTAGSNGSVGGASVVCVHGTLNGSYCACDSGYESGSARDALQPDTVVVLCNTTAGLSAATPSSSSTSGVPATTAITNAVAGLWPYSALVLVAVVSCCCCCCFRRIRRCLRTCWHHMKDKRSRHHSSPRAHRRTSSRSPRSYHERSPRSYPVNSPTSYPSRDAPRSPTSYHERSPVTLRGYPSRDMVRSPTTYHDRSPTTYHDRSPVIHMIPLGSPTSYPDRSPTSYLVRSPTSYLVRSPVSHRQPVFPSHDTSRDGPPHPMPRPDDWSRDPFRVDSFCDRSL